MRAALAALLVATAVLASAAVLTTLGELDVPVDRHGEAFAGSGACARCHPDHHESWSRTHHRRMTQEASDETMLAAFDGRSLAYGGYVAQMSRGEGGSFVVEVQSETDLLARWTVERVVGSRRHQQFLAREDDLWVRLPIAWDVEEQRFFHMNGAFLTPDPEGLGGAAPITASDYMRHAARWNDNCVFCHNVGAEPRPRDDEHWDTLVAELGVACESCHGPGAEHVRVNSSPLRRYLLHETDRADPTITSPSRLSDARQTDVCARCHGQRITSDVSRYLAHGDPFVPGDDLAASSTPLAIDTTLHGDAVFAPRFWQDGTARLTAYEHQGLRQSQCALNGELTCGDCHSMHAFEYARGQLRADRVGDALCAGACHSELAAPEASAEHSGHAATLCIDCHMPRVVFGIRTVHRSHRIEVPQPSANERDGRPDACTLCHVERDTAWAEASIAHRKATSVRSRAEDELFGGDPIERAVAAAALGRIDHLDDEARRRGLLLSVMRDDPYPGVRGIAWRSIRSLGVDLPITAFTATDDAAARADAITDIASRAHITLAAPDDVEALRARADTQAIEIGE